MDFNTIPVLARGSHRGDGYGCAMNLVSWINGDEEITDFPGCVDRNLAMAIQTANDLLSALGPTVRVGEASITRLIPAEYSPRLTEIALRAMGTGGKVSDEEGARVARTFLDHPPVLMPHLILDRIERVVNRFRTLAGLDDSHPLPTAEQVEEARVKMSETV